MFTKLRDYVKDNPTQAIGTLSLGVLGAFFAGDHYGKTVQKGLDAETGLNHLVASRLIDDAVDNGSVRIVERKSKDSYLLTAEKL